MSLLHPLQLGPLKLKNAVFMAPLTRCRADNPERVPTTLHQEYYAQRATAGLLISEGLPISDRAGGYLFVPGIYTPAQVEAWKAVTAAVKAKGGHFFAQIWHVGRVSHPDLMNGQALLAPSAIATGSKSRTYEGLKLSPVPKAMDQEDIQTVISQFKQAAANALAAGFDGVELHTSNGYLFHQFFANSANQRQDEYGGSIPNRARFLFEVLEAVQEVCPLERVGLRFNPMLDGHIGIEVDEETIPFFDYLLAKLNDYPLAYVHLSRPGQAFAHRQLAEKEKDPNLFIQDVIGHYRQIYKGVLVANGGYTAQTAQEELAKNRADAIAFGKAFIANPDLVKRIEQDAAWAPWNPDTFYTQGPEGYTDYLFLSEG